MPPTLNEIEMYIAFFMGAVGGILGVLMFF